MVTPSLSAATGNPGCRGSSATCLGFSCPWGLSVLISSSADFSGLLLWFLLLILDLTALRISSSFRKLSVPCWGLLLLLL
jgi:hypothetical protein